MNTVRTVQADDVYTKVRRIDPTKDPEHLQWLWQQTMKEDYASDDVGSSTPELFISNLFLPNSEHYEYGDACYIALLNIIDFVNADLHFAMWGDMSVYEMRELHSLLVMRMFEVHKCNRITAYIPSFNKKVIRFATILGYRWEGEMRKIFLKGGVYYNVIIYGLLKEEFYRRKVG